jgi:hypothetical protein
LRLSIGFNLLSDGTILLHNDLVQAEGSLDGVGLLVHPLQFLEGTALGLDTKTVGVSVLNRNIVKIG